MQTDTSTDLPDLIDRFISAVLVYLNAARNAEIDYNSTGIGDGKPIYGGSQAAARVEHSWPAWCKSKEARTKAFGELREARDELCVAMESAGEDSTCVFELCEHSGSAAMLAALKVTRPTLDRLKVRHRMADPGAPRGDGGGAPEPARLVEEPERQRVIPKRPSPLAFTAWHLHIGGLIQTKIAEEITKRRRQPTHQGQVSKWLVEVQAYQEAGGSIPPQEGVGKSITMDPAKIGIGRRVDPRPPRPQDLQQAENTEY